MTVRHKHFVALVLAVPDRYRAVGRWVRER